jgi:hypothetical protein
MEMAVMSLSARDEQALSGIADGLACSDPVLAAMLATFTRLTSGEEMPATEEVREPARHHPTIPWLPTVAILIVGALIAVAASLTGSTSGAGCTQSLGLICVSPGPTRPPAQLPQVRRIGAG